MTYSKLQMFCDLYHLYYTKEKSRTMKFNRLSPTTDFNSKLQIISGNILYLTHEVDKIHKIVSSIFTNQQLQTQVDQFFDDKETPPQTDPVEQ